MTGVRRKRDGKIELVRFLAAVSIATYHFEWVYIGRPVFLPHFYIWVEFFFLVSGFFLYFCEDGNGEGHLSTSYRYVFSQIRKVYPLYLAGFLFTDFALPDYQAQTDVYSYCCANWGCCWFWKNYKYIWEYEPVDGI